MKHLDLQLQKRLLIVEGDLFEIPKYTQLWLDNKIIRICKGSELTEEIAKGLVDKLGDYIRNYKDPDDYYKTALESFISAIEAQQIELGITIDLNKSLIFEIL
ncbi:hypothetical protein [Chryseobacterium daeguense]|uniref:hypothetical protein n=1 Tax=Chryseobacterium daeguense TaxID=412438 RepID=UPI000428AF3B|nr:hypothetical protein [Chryseobacterium daeguense]